MKSAENVVAVCILLVCCPALMAGANETPILDNACDIAPFGFRVSDENGRWHGLRWAEPRKVRQVVIRFADGQSPPDPDVVTLQYWHRTWDGKADPVHLERGAGGVGWDAMDDWTNGKWIDAGAELNADASRWTFTLLPITDREIKSADTPGVTYRKTLWIRLLSKRQLPPLDEMHVFAESSYLPLGVRIQFGTPASASAKTAGAEVGHLEVYNGRLLNVRCSEGSSISIDRNMRWTLPSQSEGTIEADLLMASDPMDARYDRTVVTVRTSHRPFSFAADEVAGGDRILVDDLGVLVTNKQDTTTLQAYREALRTNFRGKTVYDRVEDSHEQTLSRAWNDMPLKWPLNFVHGLPGNRNTMRQHPNGEIDVTSVGRWFNLQRSKRDSDRKLWEGDRLRISLGFPESTLRGGRRLKDGYLPLLYTWWQDGPIYYEHTSILDALDADLSDVDLDDPTVLLMRVRAVNVSDTDTGSARLRFASSSRRQDKLIVRHGQAVAHTSNGQRLRFVIDTAGRGVFAEDGNVTAWSAELGPGDTETLYVYVPSVTVTSEQEVKALQKRDFDADVKRVCSFWQKLTSKATQIQTPEPWINDFYKSHLRHLLINCFKELDSDLLHAHVGTFHYGVYPNESVMMISDLDRRGLHDHARRNLDSFLHYQGTVSMPGNFESSEGQFYGAGGHETGGYNKSHGYVMWNMAEHWWMTRDRDWMERSADKLVKACDWVARERKATMRLGPDGSKQLEYGYLPSGSLEDVTDYWYWLATNSATVWGFRSLSSALADFGHPESERLEREARAYYDDFLRAITESRIRCPVVRLRDGTYVPKIPSRLYERGRAHGWLRETLEGALFLPAYNLLAPEAPETRWILKDYEDNLYISERYGYAIPAFEQFWFSRGGFSMQANLLDGPLPYLWRDDIKHFVRAYFNGFASAFYPEIRMCNEHSLPGLGHPRGDHFKTSDEAQSTYWLRLMFVNEMGQDLYLGQAIPRYWLSHGNIVGIKRAPSHFGVLSFEFKSYAAENRIEVVLDPPSRNRPENIFVRIRHPRQRPIKSVTVNGMAYKRFDVDKEWIVLTGSVNGRQQIVVSY
ncbi:MAG: hypothetical protein JSU70_04445 [Phycisphaerales bacterium]|nr:MAG: hypothetical protein JSU70_04445 [Phycisphaerales bacterium]